ncbi:hypothetical protein V6N12_065019 [Hibiscus sabdariffa]|uniref:Uncharacterized protein n=1 Tax=Hibiscus sabdariffa TaxID=183260 RepID=A0ABR2G7Q1_9ROSI
MAGGSLIHLRTRTHSSFTATDLSFVPENDIVELVWENGQVSMQGQSSKARKMPSCNSLPSHIAKIYKIEERSSLQIGA